MKAMLARNLKVYFRDKAAVFFSMLAVILIFLLYVLFLGDMIGQDLPNREGARALIDSWIMAGILAVTSVSTVMGALGTMVDDRAKKLIKDFGASPISRGQLTGGYVLSSFTVGMVMTIIAFVLSEAYIVLRGGEFLLPVQMLEVVGLLVLSTLCNTAVLAFIVSFLKSQNAFGTASSLLGTLIGFIAGIYMPVGVMPQAIQTVIKIFPVSHAALLIRNIMMEAPMKTVSSSKRASASAARSPPMPALWK